MRAFAVALRLVCLPAALVGQTSRWAVRIESPAGIEHGELRLEAKGGRLLLESRDSAYITLTQFERSAERLVFTIAPMAARVTADLSPDGTRMRGWLTAANGARRDWSGELITPGTERWPVRPRVRVRQLLFGSGADVTIIPASWVRAMPDSARLEAEYQQLAEATRLPRISAGARAERSRAMVLGADDTSRAMVRQILEGIAARHRTDTAFRRIFIAEHGVRVDVHERAEEFAAARSGQFVYADAARALVLVGELSADARGARSRARLEMLSLWSRWRADDSLTLARLDMLQLRDRAASRALTALLEGYDQAVPWWRDAVVWLLEHPWLETANGPLSVVQRVSQLWHIGTRDTLMLPMIAPVFSGGFAATPRLAGDRLAQRLIEPLNASAVDWLALGRTDAISVWRGLNWDDTLTVGFSGQSVTLLAPKTATQRPSLGPLLAKVDRIDIDPGIVPLFAVSTVIHEWHHLLATSRRLSWLEAFSGSVRLEEEDPWLAEGFAEWATEETLRPTRQSAPLLTFVDAEKRMALWGGMSDDPHALGYRLVRAAVGRIPIGQYVKTLVIYLHDPTGLASMASFGTLVGTSPLLLRRPMTLAVIPEITFTWDAGVADFPTRRLLFPLFPPER